MNMEHRYDPRTAIENRILIHVHSNTFVSGIMQNISYGGLSLKSSQIQHLKKNGIVRAAFRINGELVILPSQVVRICKNEGALMFIEQATPRKKRLYNWLNDAVCA